MSTDARLRVCRETPRRDQAPARSRAPRVRATWRQAGRERSANGKPKIWRQAMAQNGHARAMPKGIQGCCEKTRKIADGERPIRQRIAFAVCFAISADEIRHSARTGA